MGQADPLRPNPARHPSACGHTWRIVFDRPYFWDEIRLGGRLMREFISWLDLWLARGRSS
jgi:hypothetical protein